MTTTPDLIDRLVACATPVRRLQPPLVRAGWWLLFAALLLGFIGAAHGLRPDIFECMRQPRFVVAMFGALATGVLAAVASFRVSLPDGSRLWLLLPSPALALWVSAVGYGCLNDWVSIGPDGIRLGEAVRCFATLVLTSVPLSVAMLVMLSHAALLRATEVSLAGGLAVAAVSSFALSLFHDLDATVMILMWNLGSAAVLATLGAVFGKSMFRWTAARLTPMPEHSINDARVRSPVKNSETR
jgi:hypothetical protein